MTLTVDPERQFKCITRLDNAKPYSVEWFVEDKKGEYKPIEPSNQINEIRVNELSVYPIGVIDNNLKVTLYSSYQMKSDYESRQQKNLMKSYKNKK